MLPIIMLLCVIGIVGAIWVDHIPFAIFSFWRIEGNIGDWWQLCWVFCIVGLILGTCIILFSRKPSKMSLGDAIIISGQAAIVEEIIWRWGLFLFVIPWLRGGNWLLGGFIGEGWGVGVFFHHYIFGPIANIFTGGILHDYLFHSEGWFVGAALLLSNSAFRNGHRYQGWPGYINSWFVGMGLFAVFFKYGLIPAIIIHFLYDLVLFGFQAFKSTAHGNH